MGRLFYHYTSISGFEAILKSGSLRMTRSDFMNDPNDCRVFLDVVKKHIESKPLERFVMEGGLNYQAATLEIAKKCRSLSIWSLFCKIFRFTYCP